MLISTDISHLTSTRRVRHNCSSGPYRDGEESSCGSADKIRKFAGASQFWVPRKPRSPPGGPRGKVVMTGRGALRLNGRRPAIDEWHARLGRLRRPGSVPAEDAFSQRAESLSRRRDGAHRVDAGDGPG